ncbi:MAG: hypothetical protein IJ047_01745 [Paludibacteraceae bacterium]|nr:hypothetical protein [Paludibacteraceae bacterium]
MVKVKFPDFIKSMSGTLFKRRLPDGSVRRLIVTKKGCMYETTTFPKTGPLSSETIEKQIRFGLICKAVPMIRKAHRLPTDPATRKRLFRSLGKIYDRYHRQGKTITPESLAKEWETRNGGMKE